jgi:hypothetical protein
MTRSGLSRSHNSMPVGSDLDGETLTSQTRGYRTRDRDFVFDYDYRLRSHWNELKEDPGRRVVLDVEILRSRSPN